MMHVQEGIVSKSRRLSRPRQAVSSHVVVEVEADARDVRNDGDLRQVGGFNRQRTKEVTDSALLL